jgi:hypothetical protein
MIIGDIVKVEGEEERLMEVVSLHGASAECTWRAGSEIHRAEFPINSLVPVVSLSAWYGESRTVG